jgi:hypothetical protein
VRVTGQHYAATARARYIQSCINSPDAAWWPAFPALVKQTISPGMTLELTDNVGRPIPKDEP